MWVVGTYPPSEPSLPQQRTQLRSTQQYPHLPNHYPSAPRSCCQQHDHHNPSRTHSCCRQRAFAVSTHVSTPRPKSTPTSPFIRQPLQKSYLRLPWLLLVAAAISPAGAAYDLSTDVALQLCITLVRELALLVLPDLTHTAVPLQQPHTQQLTLSDKAVRSDNSRAQARCCCCWLEAADGSLVLVKLRGAVQCSREARHACCSSPPAAAPCGLWGLCCGPAVAATHAAILVKLQWSRGVRG